MPTGKLACILLAFYLLIGWVLILTRVTSKLKDERDIQRLVVDFVQMNREERTAFFDIRMQAFFNQHNWSWAFTRMVFWPWFTVLVARTYLKEKRPCRTSIPPAIEPGWPHVPKKSEPNAETPGS